MFSYRVITGAIILAGSVFASGLFAGDALAQYEPVGKPLQLVPPSYSSKSAATPRSRVTAKKAAKFRHRVGDEVSLQKRGQGRDEGRDAGSTSLSGASTGRAPRWLNKEGRSVRPWQRAAKRRPRKWPQSLPLHF